MPEDTDKTEDKTDSAQNVAMTLEILGELMDHQTNGTTGYSSILSGGLSMIFGDEVHCEVSYEVELGYLASVRIGPYLAARSKDIAKAVMQIQTTGEGGRFRSCCVSIENVVVLFRKSS